MEQPEIKINIPDGYEIDNENSTFQCIKFKKVINTDNNYLIKDWPTLCRYKKVREGCFINGNSDIVPIRKLEKYQYMHDRNLFLSESDAKASLAMAQISQLMPFYGGKITPKEWLDEKIAKFILQNVNNEITSETFYVTFSYLAFHTREQMNDFLINNRQLVEDYLMIK